MLLFSVVIDGLILRAGACRPEKRADTARLGVSLFSPRDFPEYQIAGSQASIAQRLVPVVAFLLAKRSPHRR
jgi:hypothetical protein